MNRIFQPAKLELDQIAGSAKFNICSLRQQNAIFSENILDFIHPNHGFGSFCETDHTNVNRRMCSKNRWKLAFEVR